MFRLISFFIFFVIVSNVTFGQNTLQKADKLKWNFYQSQDKKYELRIPNNWSVEENFEEYRFFIRSVYDSNFDTFLENITINIQENQKGEPENVLKTYVSSVVEELPKFIKGIQISTPKFFNIKNTTWSEIACKHYQQPHYLKWKQLSFMQGTTLVTMTFTSEESSYSNYDEIANIVMLSFKNISHLK